jgi:CRP-like cAMP-binding protein
MSLGQDIELLSLVALFEEFQEEHLRLLAFGADKRTIIAGAEIFHLGAFADCGYVVANGIVQIVADNPEEQKIIGEYGRASMIGELAMISEGNRNCTVIAKGQVELMVISRKLFRRMLQEYPELAEIVHARISGSVQNFISRLEHIQRKLDHIDME